MEIRRTKYGVPHILGDNLRAVAFGLAWVMMEDYRERVPELILRSNGRWGLAMGREAAQRDFAGRMAHDLAVQTHNLLPPDVQEVVAGYRHERECLRSESHLVFPWHETAVGNGLPPPSAFHELL